MGAEAQPILQLQGCTVRFGGLTALSALDLAVAPGELVGLIGPNGAGKSTTFNAITGVYPLSEGLVRFEGRPINGTPPHRVARLGIARTFQTVRLFGNLSVLDNVKCGAHMHAGYGWLQAIVLGHARMVGERRLTLQAREVLALVGLSDWAQAKASSLPYGGERLVEIARALAGEPKLLLLDEPAAGMNPQETDTLLGFIRRIREAFGLTIVLIEHDMRLVMNVCERICVLDHGERIAEGAPHEIRADPRVIGAYLGEPEADA